MLPSSTQPEVLELNTVGTEGSNAAAAPLSPNAASPLSPPAAAPPSHAASEAGRVSESLSTAIDAPVSEECTSMIAVDENKNIQVENEETELISGKEESQTKEGDTSKETEEADDTTDAVNLKTSPRQDANKDSKMDDCCLTCVSFTVQCCECSLM